MDVIWAILNPHLWCVAHSSASCRRLVGGAYSWLKCAYCLVYIGWYVLAVGIKRIDSHHSTVGFIKCWMHPLFTLSVLTKTQLHWDILSWSLVDL